jgi:PDZ domain-containing protein
MTFETEPTEQSVAPVQPFDDGAPPAMTVPPPPPRRRRRIWPWVVIVVVLITGLVVVAASSITVDYYAVAPGPVENVADYVVIDGDSFEADGDLYFLTVVLEEVTILEYLEASINSETDLRPRETIRPDGVSQEQLSRANQASMNESIERAIYVALTELGYEASLTGDGALVVGIVESSPAVGLLHENDIIVAVNGEPVSMASEAVTLVSRTGPGDEITLTVQRDVADGGDPETVPIVVALGVHPDDDTRGFIGVFLDTANFTADFPIAVSIDAGSIGGPSAGMMYALGVMNQLTPEDLTKGWQIAGTGTIDFERNVGPIGGIRQKVYAARAEGADYVLVPAANYKDALTASGDGIIVVSIETFDDVMTFLDALEPAPPGPVAEG